MIVLRIVPVAVSTKLLVRRYLLAVRLHQLSQSLERRQARKRMKLASRLSGRLVSYSARSSSMQDFH